MKFLRLSFIAIIPFLLSACHQYHSEDYYLHHPKKCIERLTYCKENYGTIFYENQDCKNAYNAYLEIQKSHTDMK